MSDMRHLATLFSHFQLHMQAAGTQNVEFVQAAWSSYGDTCEAAIRQYTVSEWVSE